MNTIQNTVTKQRDYFMAGNTLPIRFRKHQLTKLYEAILRSEEKIHQALKKDLNKSAFEAYETEISLVLEEARYMLGHMERLAAPKRVHTPLAHFPSASHILQEPYGVVLVMSPWNYPFQLTMVPLIGAIATGNCVIVKPSNYSPETSAMIRELLAECFDSSYVAVIEGGRDANQSLLAQKFDYIFFTGSIPVGKLVMTAAAQNLTPLTLELGGKSPCIVDETADIPLAAKRIAWGKCLNSGQTCVAPDYILVHKSVKAQLISELEKSVYAMYGKEPQHNRDYPKIINRKHFERLVGLMENSHVAFGGEYNPDTLQIAPAVLDNTDWESLAMQEEIFGPLLPVLEFSDIQEVVTSLKKRPKSLALYLFTNSSERKKLILGSVSFGGGCVNDTVVHLANSHLPFGGVGESGMGGYHGAHSFQTFSHAKSVLTKKNWLDIPLRYPPFKNHLTLLKKIL